MAGNPLTPRLLKTLQDTCCHQATSHQVPSIFHKPCGKCSCFVCVSLTTSTMLGFITIDSVCLSVMWCQRARLSIGGAQMGPCAVKFPLSPQSGSPGAVKFSWSPHFGGPGAAEFPVSPHVGVRRAVNFLMSPHLGGIGLLNLLCPHISTTQGLSNFLYPCILAAWSRRISFVT